MVTRLLTIDSVPYAFYNFFFTISHDLSRTKETMIRGSFDIYIDQNTMVQSGTPVRPYKFTAGTIRHDNNIQFKFRLKGITVRSHRLLKKGRTRFYYEAKGIELYVSGME